MYMKYTGYISTNPHNYIYITDTNRHSIERTCPHWPQDGRPGDAEQLGITGPSLSVADPNGKITMSCVGICCTSSIDDKIIVM